MMRRLGQFSLAVALAGVLGVAGCVAVAQDTASFDRTLTVSGPVRVDLTNGSGSVRITGSATGQVRIHGDVRRRAFFFGHTYSAKEVADDPPIEQQGNVIRIGDRDRRRFFAGFGGVNLTIDYVIEVPKETEIETRVGSGAQSARNVRGPVKLVSGSGRVSADTIGEDVQIVSGSGSIEASGVGGEFRGTTGSGGVAARGVHGDIRVTTGSGSISVARPDARVNVKTGSGSIMVQGANDSLTAMAGSGSLTIDGNPSPSSFWELHTGSGSVNLGLPASGSFRLNAVARSGKIQAGIPIVIEEQSRRELRARVGSGAARIEVQTGSGTIRIQ
ncbi:MAG TPA: DUF4097 family beta strand repeat-containing protein [Candidatus Acidoferrales bacterium]|nr:DUF4097 family beta strand repeat-containing protein [Candidatus Acidoferrales bacterium]